VGRKAVSLSTEKHFCVSEEYPWFGVCVEIMIWSTVGRLHNYPQGMWWKKWLKWLWLN